MLRQRLGLGLGPRRAGLGSSGGGGGSTTLAEIDFAVVATNNPFVSEPGWTTGRNFSAGSRTTGTLWIANGASGQVAIWADIGTVDLTGEPKVFAAINNMQAPNASGLVALALFEDYDNGIFWDAGNGDGLTLIDGYLLQLTPTQLIVFAYDAGNTYASFDFGNPLGGSGGTLTKVELRVTIGGSNNTLQAFVNDVKLGGDFVDSDAARVTDLRTVGGSVEAGGGGEASMARLSVGTFT